MPIKYEGNHVCERCGESFKWIYFEPLKQKLSQGKFVVEDIPTDKTLAYEIKTDDQGNKTVYVNCPYCDWDNHFEFIPR